MVEEIICYTNVWHETDIGSTYFFSTGFFIFLFFCSNIIGFDNVSKSTAENPREFFECDHLNIKNLQKSRIFQLILSISVKRPKYVDKA